VTLKVNDDDDDFKNDLVLKLTNSSNVSLVFKCFI